MVRARSTYYDRSDPSAFDRTAVALLVVAKKDAPKRFEFFCVQNRSAPTSSRPSGEEVLQLACSDGYGLRQPFVSGFPSVDKFQEFSVLLAYD